MLYNYDETSCRWSRVSPWRKAGMMAFWFGIAALFALFVWTLWAASGAVIDWLSTHGG